MHIHVVCYFLSFDTVYVYGDARAHICVGHHTKATKCRAHRSIFPRCTFSITLITHQSFADGNIIVKCTASLKISLYNIVQENRGLDCGKRSPAVGHC